MRDKHQPRCRCPFCNFMWTRPGKIKAHLIVDHAEMFTAEMLEGITSLRGRRIIEFVDACDHVPDLDATLQFLVQVP